VFHPFLHLRSRVSLNSPTCRKTLVGVHVPVPISEQAEKPKCLSFHALLSRCHHFLRLQRNFSKIQRKICHRTIFALIFGRMVKLTYRLRQMVTFLVPFPKTPILPTFNAIMAIWLTGLMAIMASNSHVAIWLLWHRRWP
jgi:hypothetical protein